MKKYDSIILDGNNMFFKAFAIHGKLSIPRIEGSLFTGGTFGLIQSIISAKRDYLKENGNMYIVWDKGHKRRSEIYPEYKANRNKDEWEDYENFKAQMKMAKYVLSFMGIYQVIKDGEEADDLAGTIAFKLKNEGKKVLLVSADKDFQQLIDENIDLMAHKGSNNIKIWNKEEWKKEKGYYPEYFSIFLALNGDKGDNIPGIHGIGEVAANKLINENFDLLESILNEKDITPFIPEKLSSVINKLISKEGIEKFRLSYKLSLIDKNVDNYKIKKYKNVNKLIEIFETLQFHSLLKNHNLEIIKDM